ncbi:tetratricopeptide repeat protein [Gimesia fumaroli]|uniref:Tetratricopeptide repeat protein n=1 Tax=Gimesia fumaroli TaxID=2527976 RepID=A0A518I5D1_9PLAN|nr:tetratricopeptide repeat protein [Gimesia fumaroli]QDV48263.1 Tetratricopeptide repeat protein [Gimesia fumaroli]
MRSRNGLCLITALISATLLLWPAVGTAQTERAKKNDPATDSGSAVSNAESRQRLLEIEQRLKALNQQPAHQPTVSRESEAFLIIDNAVKGLLNNPRDNKAHFFLARLTLVNQSQRPLKLIRNQIKATVDGQNFPVAGLPKNLSYQSVQLGKVDQSLNRLKFEDEVEVAPGKQGSLWLVLSEIAADGRIPEFQIQTMINGQPLHLNVNRFELGKLQHTVQRIGPNQCLAEFTIRGELNSINVGSLVHEIDLLTAKNIKRYVLYFPAAEPNIERKVKEWLPRAAESIGTNTIVERRFPAFPTMISKLHLAGKAFKDDKPRYPSIMATQFAHATETAAIHAALDSAMKLLPREQVAEQIRTGSPAVQVAGLISGGRQLTNEEVPLVLQRTTDQNAEVQLAALYALRYLGDPRVFERLESVAQMHPGPEFEMAIASLAESRFAKGQQVLLKLLQQHPPEAQKVIIGIIAQSPRPQWGAAIYKFLDSENLGLHEAAIKALVLNGHPQLLEVLTQTLSSPHANLREVAFQELVKRKDSASEALAIDYVLMQLQKTPPTQEMLTFIDRLKDARAIPLLFRHLQKSKLETGLRVMVIKTLASIGDQTVDEEFLKFYPQANSNEKVLILSALQKMESPHYYKLAAQALNDKNQTVITGVISGLRSSSSIEAVTILQNTLHKTDQQAIWSRIYSTLVSIGTPEARQAIMQARYSGTIDARKQAAHAALSSLYRYSPGHQYFNRGEKKEKSNDWQDAIDEYQTAISIDSQLVPAYLRIVNAKTELQQYEEALQYADQGLKIDDKEPRLYVAKGLIFGKQSQTIASMEQFQKAVDIDPRNPFPHTLLASRYSQLRQFDKAIKSCDAAIELNPKYFSPYFIKAKIYNDQERWDEAIQVYDQFMLQDKTNYEAYTGRGHTHLLKTDWKAAQKDFQKAFELNKQSSQAITGLALCMVYNKEEEKAIAFVEERAKQFTRNDLFQYNTACVFGRVLFNLKDQPQTPELQKKRKAYQDKAIQYLTNSYQQGFTDVEWIQKDPDLAELQELPAFKSLVERIKKGPAKAKP